MALPPGVRVDLHPSGLERLVIDRDACRAELFLHGATLTGWAPRGEDEVLFTSPTSLYRADKPIRGGVPICFPWFGPRPGAAQHGFARTSKWALVSAEEAAEGAVELMLGLDGDGTHPDFGHPFRARYRVTLGTSLGCALEVTNTGSATFTYQDALHAYFAIDDVRAVRVRGLEALPYLDRSAGGSVPRVSEGAPFGLVGETDRAYLATEAPVEVLDGARTLVIEKSGARSTVVWNPGVDKAAALADLGAAAWTRMLCVEPANAQSDAVELAAGSSHTTHMRVTVRRA